MRSFIRRCIVMAGFFVVLSVTGFIGIMLDPVSKAQDEIREYVITVDANPDGSLTMDYKIKWHIVSDNGDKPLTWVKIGIPNSNIDNIEAVSSNIKSANYYYDQGDYIRVDFNRSYTDGDVFEFEYKFTQYEMACQLDDKILYDFTPGWFDTIPVRNITIRWDADLVDRVSSGAKNEDGYLVWTASMAPGQRMPLVIVYPPDAFNVQHHKIFRIKLDTTRVIVLECLTFIILLIVSCIRNLICVATGKYIRDDLFGFGSYSGGGGFGGGGGGCACACACAGGGRAGCSSKDFYGTKLESVRIRNRLKAQFKDK